MKKQFWIFLIAALIGMSARAELFSYTLNNIFATIPDGNLNGYQSSQSVVGIPGAIQDINVTLNISGGFNGDFYAYLSHNGSAAILLNRPGRSSTSGVGYSDAGLGPDGLGGPFTFDDQASHDVHLYRSFSYSLNGSGQLTGAWQPDGRIIDPLSPGSTFDAASRSGMLGIFNSGSANGVWTLFVADVSAGGEGTLVSWGMQITAVPEPCAVALLGCGLGGAVVCWRRRRGD